MLRICGLGVVLSLAVAAAAVLAVWLMDWWGSHPSIRLFVPEELARYRGGPGDPGLYLALLGRVYDVSSGRKHYEPGAHYSGFAGISEALTPSLPAWAHSHRCSMRSSSSLFIRASSSHILRWEGHGPGLQLGCNCASYVPARSLSAPLCD